jgi:hypothetical protein
MNMLSNKPKGEDKFSFGVRELRQSKAAHPLALQSGPLVAVDEDRGADPYNTSGSFDRKKHWSRVGKR